MAYVDRVPFNPPKIAKAMNRPGVGYNRLCVDARTFDDPPQWFCQRENSGEFLRLQFERLPEISRLVTPQKRAKLTSTSGLFRRQSAKIRTLVGAAGGAWRDDQGSYVLAVPRRPHASSMMLRMRENSASLP